MSEVKQMILAFALAILVMASGFVAGVFVTVVYWGELWGAG